MLSLSGGSLNGGTVSPCSMKNFSTNALVGSVLQLTRWPLVEQNVEATSSCPASFEKAKKETFGTISPPTSPSWTASPAGRRSLIFARPAVAELPRLLARSTTVPSPPTGMLAGRVLAEMCHQGEPGAWALIGSVQQAPETANG